MRSRSVRGFPPSRRAWTPSLGALLRRGALLVAFTLSENVGPVVKLIKKYSNVPMGFADACLVRMTETLADPIGSLCDTRVILPPLIPAETEPGPTSARLVWRQKPEQQQWLEAREGDYLLRTNLTGNGAADLWKKYMQPTD